MTPPVLWTPPDSLLQRSSLGAYRRERGFDTYDELWRWSVSDLEAFWGPLAGGLLWDRFGQPGLVFLPVAVASPLLVVLGPLLPHHEPHSDSPRAALPGPAAPLSTVRNLE